MRRHVGDPAAWSALFERPLGEFIESRLAGDAARGVVLTDALIGTFTHAHAVDLRQNRCFLYHVIGGGTGEWDVPVGGMGTVAASLEAAAVARGVELRTGAEVTAVRVDDDGATIALVDGGRVQAAQVLANAAPAVLDRLLGTPGTAKRPRVPSSRSTCSWPTCPAFATTTWIRGDAFAGTFRVNEGYAQLQRAYEQAASGRIPELPPSEIYCHSLTDPTILGDDLVASGAQTLTLFAMHHPARLFRQDPNVALRQAFDATIASLDSVLAEPIADCLLAPECIEAMGPLEIEAKLAMPGGNIFHRDLQWPFAERAAEEGRWGTETAHANVFVCGAGARRGGGVSGIPGRNAAMAALGR